MPLEYLKPLLTGLGIDEKKADELLNIPEDKQKDFKPDEVVDAAKKTWETKLKNDPEFLGSLSEDVLPEPIIKSIESKQYGKAAAMTRQHLIKGMGLTDADFEDLGDDGKKIQVFVKRAVEKFVAGKSTDEKLQNDLIAARKELDKLKEEEPQKLTELENRFKTESDARMFEFIVLTNLANFKNLKVPVSYVVDKVTAKLKSTYAFEVEGMDATPKQKNNPKLDVIVGTDKLTLGKAIEKILTDDDLLAKEVTPTKEKGNIQIDVEGSGGELKISSHIADKIKKVMELEGKAQ